MPHEDVSFEFDVPPVRPEPPKPVKHLCFGGLWHGATITHMPDDTAERATNGGVYRWNPSTGTWQFHASGF